MTIRRDDPRVKPLGEPLLEPLSEMSWKRIENSIFAELDREAVAASRSGARFSWRRRSVSMWAAAAACACAAGIAIALWALPDRGNDSSGEMAAFEPSRIVTATSPARMTVGRASITVAPESALWIQGDEERGVQIILEQGRVDCAVAPHPDRPPFVVQAGDVRVEVVGTRFMVARHATATAVEVQKGVVTVFHDGERTELGAGQSWSGPRVAAGDLQSSAGAEGSSAGEGSRSVMAGAGPAEAKAPPGAASTDRGKARKTTAQSAQPRDQAPEDADQALYEKAARLEASDPAAARALYRQIMDRGGPWSANALFAQARLELELGQRGLARDLLQTYLRKYPGGANAQDARELLGQIQ